MSLVLVCPFDPITSSEIEFAKKVVQEKKEKKIFLMPFGPAVLSLEERTQLIQKAIAPFKKLAFTNHFSKDDLIVEFADCESEEAAARMGNFMKVPANIREELNRHGYYYDCIAQACCTPQRYQHSLRVAETARTIALWHHLDGEQAYRAGLLHDVTKKCSKEENEAIIAAYKPEWLTLSEKVWHSYTATVFLKQNLGLHDDKLLYAIAHHTLGDGRTPLAQILYIADKIEPGRGYDVSEHMALAKMDLTRCVAFIRSQSKRYILEKEGIHV